MTIHLPTNPPLGIWRMYVPLNGNDAVLKGGVKYQGYQTDGDGGDHTIGFAWDAAAGASGRLRIVVDGVVVGGVSLTLDQPPTQED